MEKSLRYWSQYRLNVYVTLLFVLLTTFMAWPLLTELDSSIIGDSVDVYIHPWADWWTKKALLEPETILWYSPDIFYPLGANLIYHSFSHLNSLVSLSLGTFLDSLIAYNLTILFNYVLAGVAMFQLANYLSGSYLAGILAGIIFTFNSYNIYQSAHPVLVSIWCLPWLTLFFLRAIRETKVKWAVVAAVVLFLWAATSIHLLIFMSIWIMVLVASLLLTRRIGRSDFRPIFIFGLITTGLVLPLIYPQLKEIFLTPNTSFKLGSQVSVSTDIFSIFVPAWYLWYSRGIYFGLFPWFLLLLAVRLRKATIWLLLLFGAYLFAIGPRPEFFTIPLNFTLPWSSVVASFIRHTHRLNVLVAFGLAMVAAYGFVEFERRLGTHKWRLAALLFGIVLTYVEYAVVFFPYTPVNVSAFYTDFLGDVPDDVALVILPTGRHVDKRHMYEQTLHGHPITGGHVSRVEAETLQFVYGNPLLRAGNLDLEPVAIPRDVRPYLEALAEENIRYLILEKDYLDIEVWQVSLGRLSVYEDDKIVVYSTLLNPDQESEG